MHRTPLAAWSPHSGADVAAGSQPSTVSDLVSLLQEILSSKQTTDVKPPRRQGLGRSEPGPLGTQLLSSPALGPQSTRWPSAPHTCTLGHCHLGGKHPEAGHFSHSRTIHCKKLETGSRANHLLRDRRNCRYPANHEAPDQRKVLPQGIRHKRGMSSAVEQNLKTPSLVLPPAETVLCLS